MSLLQGCWGIKKTDSFCYLYRTVDLSDSPEEVTSLVLGMGTGREAVKAIAYNETIYKVKCK